MNPRPIPPKPRGGPPWPPFHGWWANQTGYGRFSAVAAAGASTAIQTFAYAVIALCLAGLLIEQRARTRSREISDDDSNTLPGGSLGA